MKPKPQQQNNPVVLGVLSVAFVFILFRIFKTLTGGGEPLPPAQPDAAKAIGATATLQTASLKTGSNASSDSRRDPFDHPHLAHLAAEEAAKLKRMNGTETPATPTPKATSGQKTYSGANWGASLPDVAPPTYSSKPILGGFSNGNSTPAANGSNVAPAGTQNNSAAKTNAPAAPDPTEKWRVTAILGGSQPSAVIESPEMAPRTVRLGDEIMGFRIAAIRKSEIVIQSPRAVLTLPLDIRSDENKTQTESTEKMPVRLAAQPSPPQERKHEN